MMQKRCKCDAKDMLCRWFAALRKKCRNVILKQNEKEEDVA